MDTRNYWLNLFSGTTWQQFLDAGAEVSGFREGRWKTVQQIKPGDYLLCYLTGVSRWIGILEVVSGAYKDQAPIWTDGVFPCRVRVKIVASLKPETAVPIFELRDELSIFQNLSSPFAWTGHLRGSPAKWKVPDGEAVVSAVLDAARNPIPRPVNPAKLARKSPILKAKFGLVTVPESEEPVQQSLGTPASEAPAAQVVVEPISEEPSSEILETPKEPTLHTEIQWLLLKLGNDMGFDVWVARNDRSRELNGNRFVDLPRLKKELSLRFDEAVNRTIELIDVLWLKGNTIVAAFEIESTTSIYSGLLRMSDLIAMQPNLSIPLYLVAPDERRDKVMLEVNRPTFSRLSPPLNEVCRFIPFTGLRDRISQVASVIRYLKPEFLEELSESCEIEEL